jgi:hypothetical protein
VDFREQNQPDPLATDVRISRGDEAALEPRSNSNTRKYLANQGALRYATVVSTLQNSAQSIENRLVAAMFEGYCFVI